MEQKTSAGEFAQPNDFSAETQKGAVVGLQSEMNQDTKPVHTKQEGEYGFESYKAAGWDDLGVFCISQAYSGSTRFLASLQGRKHL